MASAGRLIACKRAMDPIDPLAMYAGRGTAFLLQRIERPWENSNFTDKSVTTTFGSWQLDPNPYLTCCKKYVSHSIGYDFRN